LIALTGITAIAIAGARAQDPPELRAEREIRALEAKLSEAVIAGDRAFFERVLAADFTHTSHSGQFKSRAQWMAENKFENRPGRPQPGKTHYQSFDVEDLAVRIYGETAVVTGRSIPRGTTAKGEPICGRYRYLRVWVKRAGQWQVVAFEG